jgi:hypothetical protein
MASDIRTIRARVRELTAQAELVIRRADSGAVKGAAIAGLITEVDAVLGEATVGLLDAADQAAAAGDPCLGDEFYGIAMEIEEELLRGAPPVVTA